MTQRVYPGDLRLARQLLAAGNFERACYFDPSLRSRVNSMAADSAAAAALIDRAVSAAIHRETHAADRRPTSRTKPVQKRPRGLTAAQSNRLFQLRPGDPGYREARGTHALDESAPDVAGLIRRALVRLRDEPDADDIAEACEHLERALRSPDAEDDREDREHEDEVTEGDKHGGPTRIRARDEEEDDIAGGRWETPRKNPNKELGRDGVGKTPARSAVSLRGADSAPGHYDPGALFQEPKP
jgi:hypothetical protein